MSKAALHVDERFAGVDMDEARVLPFLGGELAFYTHRLPDKPTVNEDSLGIFSVSDHRGAVVVADGCGGMQSGEVASAIVVEEVGKGLAAVVPGDSLRSAILDSLEAANDAILSLGTGAATTVLVVEFDENRVRSIHAGDSQVLLIGGRGKLKLQSLPHSPVGYAMEAGMIDQQEAIDHEERHLVSNVLGSKSTHFEVGPPRTMAQRDTLLLASDGVFDNLREEEITQLARHGAVREVADNIVATAQERMGATGNHDMPSKPDDIALILFRLSHRPL